MHIYRESWFVDNDYSSRKKNKGLRRTVYNHTVVMKTRKKEKHTPAARRAQLDWKKIRWVPPQHPANRRSHRKHDTVLRAPKSGTTCWPRREGIQALAPTESSFCRFSAPPSPPLYTPSNTTQQLQDLYLNDNDLEGGIPERLLNCDGLQRLYLGGNRLTGSVPRYLRHMNHLRELNIERNSLHGEVRD